MEQSKKITITLDRYNLERLFAGGSEHGVRPTAMVLALSSMRHAAAVLEAMNGASGEAIHENLAWWVASQLEVAAEIVEAVEKADAADLDAQKGEVLS